MWMQDEKRIKKLMAHGLSHPMAELLLFRHGQLSDNQLIWVIGQCQRLKNFEWNTTGHFAQLAVDRVPVA
jgi:hypothetical protein